MPCKGRHPYDVSKSCADLIAQSYAATYRSPVVTTRCGNFFGGGDLNWSRIVPGTIRSVLLANYRDLGARVEGLKARLTSILAGFKRRGDRIAAYGAAAKGSTLLKYFGIGLELRDTFNWWRERLLGRTA
jgi:hypothetical protein